MRRFLTLCALLVSGCAIGNDCATGSFELGQRDGILAASSQAERYAAACGGSFEATRYSQGYADGFARRGRIHSQ